MDFSPFACRRSPAGTNGNNFSAGQSTAFAAAPYPVLSRIMIPSSCPHCTSPNPKLVASYSGARVSPTKNGLMVNVYKCRCGYRFVVNVKQPTPAENQSTV
jgi:hypothetical protein